MAKKFKEYVYDNYIVQSNISEIPEDLSELIGNSFLFIFMDEEVSATFSVEWPAHPHRGNAIIILKCEDQEKSFVKDFSDYDYTIDEGIEKFKMTVPGRFHVILDILKKEINNRDETHKKEEVVHKLSVVLGMLGVGAFMAVVTTWAVLIGVTGG